MNDYSSLLEKCERILKSNIYEKDKYPWGHYRMISPGKGTFPGIWNWDSAFHAIGMLDFDCEAAKEQILGFMQYMTDDGMLPDVIFEDGRVVTNFTKPPLMAYAADAVFRRTGDLGFARTVSPCLRKTRDFG